MEPGAPRVQHDAAGGSDQHPRHGSRAVTVLSQEVADALPVAGCDVAVLARVLDDERRVVLDARTEIERADQVVDLLAGRCRQPERLVERPDPLDDLALEEDREGDGAVPEIVAREHRCVRRPPRLATDDAVELADPLRDPREEIRWIHAVVVGERHDVGGQVRQRGVPRTREAGRGVETDDVVVGERRKAVVVVLVDDERPEVAMRLRAERLEEASKLARASDGRNDEVESHRRTLTPVPLVSVLLAVHDDKRFLREAVDSVLGQTLTDLELILVDDGSAEPLESVADPRVRILRNDVRLGLAASLNRALDAAAGRYVARLDADDVALPHRLERQVERLRGRTAVVGSAVVDLDECGARGQTHVMPSGAIPLRWHALFSSPFFHPTVLVDRETLDRHGLRYDTSFDESEDYDLWTRLFEHADGDNVPDALVLKRAHPAQASIRRRDVQVSFQRRVALREIGRYGVDAEAVWRGSRRELVRLLRSFEHRHGRDWHVRRAALRKLIR